MEQPLTATQAEGYPYMISARFSSLHTLLERGQGSQQRGASQLRGLPK